MSAVHESRISPTLVAALVRRGAPLCRLRKRTTTRHSAGAHRHCRADRCRTAGRLLDRPPLLQTGLQILGLCPPARSALERMEDGNDEGEAKARARSCAERFGE